MPKLSELKTEDVEFVDEPQGGGGSLSLSKLPTNAKIEFLEDESPSTAESAMRGASQGMTFGFADEATAGLGAAYDVAEAALGQRGDISFEDAYRTRRDLIREDDKEARKENPWSYGTAEVAGAVAPALVSGAAGAAAKGVTASGKAASQGVARGVGTSALGSGAAGAGYSEAEAGSPEYWQDIGLAAGLGVGTFGGARGIGNIIKRTGADETAKKAIIQGYMKAKRMPKSAAKKALANFSGVDEDHINRYLRRSDQINEVTEEGLKDKLDDTVAQRMEAREAAKHGLDEAKMNKRFADKVAREKLTKEAPPDSFPDEVADSLDDLRKRVSQKSGEAFDVLQQQEKQIPIGPLKGYLQQKINVNKIGKAATPDTKPLMKYRKFLDQTELDEMRPEDVKRFIWMLDEEAADAYAKARAPGGRLTAGDRAIIDYRKFVNQKLREVPEYREVMDQISPETQVLMEAREKFADPKRTYRLAKSLDDPVNSGERETLRKLGEATDRDLVGRLKPYEDAKATLKSVRGMQEAGEALPETKALNEAEMAFQGADEAAKPFRRFSPTSSQNALRRAASDKKPDIESQRLLSDLSEDAGFDFNEAAQDLTTQRAFLADGTRGSRNAVRFGALGGLMGSGGGPYGFAAGAGLGGQFGTMVDKKGGQWAKSALDAYLRRKKNTQPPGAHKLQDMLSAGAEKFGEYSDKLLQAQQRGEASLGATHYTLFKNDPKYRSLFGIGDHSMRARDLPEDIDSDND